MPRKLSRKGLIKKLDKLAGDKIRSRDNFTCQYCNKSVSGSDCHVSHVIPRSKGYALRWDLRNLKVLCMRDHLHWWHKNPLEANKWFEAKFPDRAKYLWEHRNDIVRGNERDEFLESKLKELQ